MDWKETKALKDKRANSLAALKETIAKAYMGLKIGDTDLDAIHAQVMEIIDGYIDAYRVDEASFPPELSARWNQHLHEISADMESPIYETLRYAKNASLELNQMRMSQLFENLRTRLLDEAAHQANRNYTFLLIQAYENEEHTHFRFVGEPGPSTCESCKTHMSGIYRLQELVEEDAIPPLHPNCKCWLETPEGERLDEKKLPADINPFTGTSPVGGKFQALQGEEAMDEALRALEYAAEAEGGFGSGSTTWGQKRSWLPA